MDRVLCRSAANLKKVGVVAALLLASLLLLSVLSLAVAQASGAYSGHEGAERLARRSAGAGALPALRTQQTATTLAVAILSSPWATLDSNPHPGEEVPAVFIVEAVITNTGSVPAADLLVALDYDEDPANNWLLLAGEDPRRGLDELGPGEVHHVYWFATYSPVPGASHRYTVTTWADNALPVATSDNYYGNPQPGRTVQTRTAQSTGSSGVIRVSANPVIGTAFQVTVTYDLSENPIEGIFSPAGNDDFDPSAYRLVAAQTRFFNDAATQQQQVAERLYFNPLPTFADNAEVTFTFIALTPTDTRMCSYAVLGAAVPKYDQFYCQADKNTILPITGTLSFVMHKQVSDLVVQQGRLLTYTIVYTNDGDLPLSYVWVWDDIDTTAATLIPASISPPVDEDATTPEQVAWYIGDLLPAEGGTLTFQVAVDGGGSDLADQTAVVNRAWMGISQGIPPFAPALSNTVTTTVQAPALLMSKSDGRIAAGPGESLVYTLQVTNVGSVAAVDPVLSDVLPAGVTYVPGSASPPETGTSPDGRTLVWDLGAPLAAGGGGATVHVPVQIDTYAANATLLTNTLQAGYRNPVGWDYNPQTTSDVTRIDAPVLSVSKSDYPDPVLTARVLTYTLSYTNSGPTGATNVLITDVLPAGLTFQRCSPAPCGASGGVVSWTLPNLASGAGGSAQFGALVSTSLASETQLRNETYAIRSDHTRPVYGPPQTTTVYRNAATVRGTAFVDANTNGRFEAGEATLAGITVALPSATQPLTLTDSGGQYRFRVELQIPITVSAALPAGYLRTTPGDVHLESRLETTHTVDFGYAPVSPALGTIYGTVFADANHDGVQNGGEPGLPGVTVSSTEAVTPSVTSNDLGQYVLTFNSDGAVQIIETNPPFYVSTTPDAMSADVVTGTSGSSPVNFGDFEGIKITGQVFDDRNVNGLKDDGFFIASANVTAGAGGTTTGGSGVYTLYTGLQDSSPVLIHETDLPGYVSTAALPGDGMQRVDANTLRIVSPVSGTLYSGADFGDVQASAAVTISGQVFDDNGAGGGIRSNGLRDGSEPGLAGAVVQLSSGMTQTTASDGAFRLYAPAGKAITLTETNPAGYVSTNAIPGAGATKVDNDSLVVQSLAGGSTSDGHLFGDVQTSQAAVIAGTVYDDGNENGVRDGDEPGLAGVTVTLEMAGGSSIPVATDAAGAYWFDVAPGTDVRITSSGPGGAYFPTTPESMVARPPAAGIYPGNDFGYSDDTGAAMLYGVVFDDANSNGLQDLGERGLAGAVMTLDGGQAITTSGNGLISGAFAYTVSQARLYTLHETNPPGYRSTTPDTARVTAVLGHSSFVQFGDTREEQVGTIYGTVFEDQNRNGAWDVDEPPLSGVSVALSGSPTPTLSNEWGQFTFQVQDAGVYTLTAADLPGYVSTNAVPGGPYVAKIDAHSLRVQVLLGVDLGNNLFGDARANPQPPCTCVADAYEQDDTPVLARPLDIGGPNRQTHDFCDDAGDWMTFTAEANQAYTITTSAWGQRADTFVTLFGPDGQSWLAANDDYAGATDFSSRILWEAPASGVFYVRATNRAALTGCSTEYDVWIERQDAFVIYLPLVIRSAAAAAGSPATATSAPAGIINHICPDGYETDDTWQTAHSIAPGVPQAHSFDSDPLHFAADKDYVYFDLAARQTVTFATTSITGTAALPDAPLLEMYDARGAALGISGATQLVWTPSAAGRYYLSVSPAGERFGCLDTAGYELTMQQAPVYGLFLPLITQPGLIGVSRTGPWGASRP